MKAAYLGGTRGYQSTLYRPGYGWSGTDRRRRFGRSRPVLAGGSARLSPLAITHRRRPGILTKMVILTVVVAVSLALAVVLGGLSLF
jgi:hypothetical protein